MTGVRAAGLMTFILVLVGCNKPEAASRAAQPRADTGLTATTLGEQVVLPTGDYLRMPRYGKADLEHGEQLAAQCRSCHSFEADGPTLMGPNLHGFLGRRAGSLGDYSYSPALEQADFVWTPEALDAWLAEPATFLPGNRMAFAGLADAADRDAVVSALIRLSSDSAREKN